MMTQSFSMPLVNAGYVQMMAQYNAEMNRRTFATAQRLSDEDRRQQHGAFWGSIHGTLCHLLWGDQMWMFRFDGNIHIWSPQSRWQSVPWIDPQNAPCCCRRSSSLRRCAVAKVRRFISALYCAII